MKNFWAVIVFLGALVTAGCSASIGTSGVHVNYGNEKASPSWQTVKYDQYDGRKLSMELPYELKEDKACFINDPNISRQEYYDNNDVGIWTSVYHLCFDDPKWEVDFGMKSFGLNLDKDYNPELKKMEKRTINGREVIYGEINMVNPSNEKLMVKCLGFDMDSEYWIIRYVYRESDKEAREIVDRSMKSITIQ